MITTAPVLSACVIAISKPTLLLLLLHWNCTWQCGTSLLRIWSAGLFKTPSVIVFLAADIEQWSVPNRTGGFGLWRWAIPNNPRGWPLVLAPAGFAFLLFQLSKEPASGTMTSCGSFEWPMNHSGSIAAGGALFILAVGTISLGPANEPRR